MNPILEQFLIEARENLLYLDKNLEHLEDGDSETINALFRAAHTLKGSSGLAGLDAVKQTTHIAEDLLDAYRNNQIEFTEPLLEALYDMFDEVTELVDTTEESGEIVEVDDNKINEFKKLSIEILGKEEEIILGIDTELIIADDETPPFAHMIQNKFNEIDLSLISFLPEELTVEQFTNTNYYIIDLDLNSDTIELGNDPFYSMFLLESDNIISLYTEVMATDEDVMDNPLNWSTRIIALVHVDQELLEDAFFNFMEDVTIYPLTLSSLLNSDLAPQSNDTIVDFIIDLKQSIIDENYVQLKQQLKAICDILNPSSLQGFLFSRILFILEENQLENQTITLMLNYIFNLIDSDINLEDNTLTIVDEMKSDEEIIEDKIIEDKIIEDDVEEKKYDFTQLDNYRLDLDEKETKFLISILVQQEKILETIKTENIVVQVKSILSKLELNLGQDFNLDSCSNIDSLDHLVKSLLSSLNYSTESGIIEVAEEIVEQTKSIVAPIIQQSSKSVAPKTVSKRPVKEKKASKPLAKTVKIDLQDIDSMMDIVGEMLVIKNSLPYIADALTVDNVDISKRDLQARYDEINRVTTALQEKVMEMRLLDLAFIFDRYPKLIRDISKALDKKIKYHEDGGDTKLDKTVIEKLADPLIHIIRNSLDHGIETPEERKSKGKNPEGNIKISAKSIGDKVYVSIEDDGKGIDVDKVVHKALEKKMVNPDELDDMSHEERLLLVFHPGVSTMDKISDLSGRGVGMDVVRQAIDDIGGKISLTSEIDVGTKITLELPMSVALTNVFHIKLGNNNYALSMDSISETVQVPSDEIEWVNKKPMLKLRGSLIPLNFHYNLLSKDIKLNDNYSLVIIDVDDEKFGLIVDEFVNQLDIVQKPLSPNFKNHPFISGTSLLGNGEILFVINPTKLINLKEKQ